MLLFLQCFISYPLMEKGFFKDKLLYLRLNRKDKDAFVEIYDMYFDHIYRFVYFKVSQKEEAEDLTSSVFLKTWGYVQDNSVKDYKTLKSFLYKVARNAVIDYYRKKSVQNEKISLNDGINTIDVADVSQDIHTKMEINSDVGLVEKNLRKLKDEYREIIVMRYLNELSIKEISFALDKTPGSIRVTLYRALNALRSLMEEDKQK